MKAKAFISTFTAARKVRQREESMNKNNHKAVSYNKWGYFFLIPFLVVYTIFTLVPLASTIYNSFFENYRSGLTQIGPNFVGLANFATLLKNGDLLV